MQPPVLGPMQMSQHRFHGGPPEGSGSGAAEFSLQGSAQVQHQPASANQPYQAHPHVLHVPSQDGGPQRLQSVGGMAPASYQQQPQQQSHIQGPSPGQQGVFQHVQTQPVAVQMSQPSDETESVSFSSSVPLTAFRVSPSFSSQVSGQTTSRLPEQRCLVNEPTEFAPVPTAQQNQRIWNAEDSAPRLEDTQETNVGKRNKGRGSAAQGPLRRGSTGSAKKPTCFDLLYNDALIRRAKKQQEEESMRAKPRRNVPGRTTQQWEEKWNAMVRKHQDKLISNEALKRRLELSKLEDERRECTFKPVTWSSRKSLREQKSCLAKLQQLTHKQRELQEAMFVLHYEDKKIDDHIAMELRQDIANAPVSRDSEDDMRSLLDFYRRRRSEEANRLCTRKLDILSEASRLEQQYKRTAASGNLDESDLAKSVGFDLGFAQSVRNEITEDIDIANSLRPGARFRAILDAVLMGEAPPPQNSLNAGGQNSYATHCGRSVSPRFPTSNVRSYTPGPGAQISSLNRSTFGGSPSMLNHLRRDQCPMPRGFNPHGESHRNDGQYGRQIDLQADSPGFSSRPHSSRRDYASSPMRGPSPSMLRSPPQMEQQRQDMAGQWTAGLTNFAAVGVQQAANSQADCWKTPRTVFHGAPNTQQNQVVPQPTAQQMYAQSVTMAGGFPQPTAFPASGGAPQFQQQHPSYSIGAMGGTHQQNQVSAGHIGHNRQYPVPNFQSGLPAYPMQMPTPNTPEVYMPMQRNLPQQVMQPQGHPSYPQYSPADSFQSYGSAPGPQQWGQSMAGMHDAGNSSRFSATQGRTTSGERGSSPPPAALQVGPSQQTPPAMSSPAFQQQQKNATLRRGVSPGPQVRVSAPVHAMAAAAKMVGGAMLRMGGNGHSTFVDFASTAKQLQRGGTVPLRG